MTRIETRPRLLAAGLDLFHRHGFAATGVQDITAAAGVPKGSFYNHFPSKEAFGAAVVDAYLAARGPAFALLAAPGLPAARRLRAHFAALTASIGGEATTTGCLLGNITGEAGALSEPLRQRLAASFAEWTAALALCLDQAAAEGAVRQAMPAAVLARILVDGWQGAAQSAKLEGGPEAMRAFACLLDCLLAA